MRVAALVVLGFAFAAPAAMACNPHPTLAGLEGQLMCPTCKVPLDESDSPEANRIRAYVSRRIAAGDSDCQIKDRLVAQFGQGVLAAPPRHGFGLLAWLLPLLALGGGAAVVGALVWRWSRGREQPAGGAPEHNGRVQLEPALERRLDEELSRFDG